MNQHISQIESGCALPPSGAINSMMTTNKAPYETPLLTIHGGVADLTLQAPCFTPSGVLIDCDIIT